MKLTAMVKLLPTPEQAACLAATLVRCNEAATWLAQVGYDAKTFRQYDLHKLAYVDMRARFDLSAQATVRTISKVADAFKINKKLAPKFKPNAAQPYDDRIFRFRKGMGSVSIWVLGGRIIIPIVMSEHQKQLVVYRKGEIDLCLIRGKWFLAVSCDIPETEPFNVEDWLGVDFGVVSLAVDSDGTVYSGAEIEQKRQHHERRRSGLQKRGTKAAKRRLRKLSGKQSRFQRHTNHVISKAIVLDAERTERGLILENLKGIQSRVTARSNQRARLGNWGFAQLRIFVEYKAKCCGVPLVFVDPRNTSRQCRECGCIDKKNRTSQALFSCISCGHQAPADLNAARNIRAKGHITIPCVLAA